MRILITCWPALGHLLPMLPLARAAQRAGHDVAIASGSDLAGEIRRLGFTAWTVGWSRTEAMDRFRAGHPELARRSDAERTTAAVTGMFVPSAGPRTRDLLRRTAAWRPDLVVHEVTEPAGAVVAARVGARCVTHALGPAPPGMLDPFLPGFAELAADFDVRHAVTRLLDDTYLDTCPAALQPGGPAGFRRVQPLRPTDGEAPGAARWAGSARLPYADTAYLTLGTTFHAARTVLETVLAGLRELPLNVVVTLGPGAGPDRLAPQPAHVLVTGFVPQALVLPHCRLVVSHGGAGAVAGALCHGLPQLLLPQGADDVAVAQACVDAGAARLLRPDEVTPEAVHDAARLLLDEPAFLAAACGIRDQIEDMPDADEVVARLHGPSVVRRSDFRSHHGGAAGVPAAAIAP